MMLRTAGDDNSGDAPARITDSASGFYAPTWSADTNTHMRIARREAAGCSYPHSCKARNHAARNGGKRTCQPFLHPNELRRAQQSELFWKPKEWFCDGLSIEEVFKGTEAHSRSKTNFCR